MINQIYYINLDRSKERMLFQENNGKKINFPMTRFNAVDAAAWLAHPPDFYQNEPWWVSR